MPAKKLNSAQPSPPSVARRVMDFLGFAIVFAGIMVQWAQNDYISGLIILCIGVLLYSLPRIFYNSSIRFDDRDTGKWQSASLADYQKLTEQLKSLAKTDRFISIKTSLILFYCLVYYQLGIAVPNVGYSKAHEMGSTFYIFLDVLALVHLFMHYKSSVLRPQSIQQRLKVFEAIIAFDYPEDFKLQIQFHMKRLRNSERTAPCDIKFLIEYRYKSPEWYSLSLVTLSKPLPFFCYAVFVATKPSPVFFAFESLILPAGWKNEAKLEKTYPSLAMVYSGPTKVAEIEKLLAALTVGIASDGFHSILKSNAQSLEDAYKAIENPDDDISK